MWKKRILCLALVLCAAMAMTACQQKETFPTSVQPETQVTEVPQDQQNIFGETPLPQSIDFDDGSYDPASEEGGDSEDLLALIAEADREGTTEMPIIQSEYAGATPVLIDPIDKPTPTPLPPVPDTVRSQGAAEMVTPEPALHNGSQGEKVWQLQERLKELGYYTGEVDGQFGPGTKEAVIAFQKKNGLDADGLAGEETQRVLYSENAVPNT